MSDSYAWIAIVDDDPSVSKVVKRSLRVRGVRGKTYGSAQARLGPSSAGLPDCLIVELEMPEMTGLELLQELKRMGIQIPTIIITAHGVNGVRELCESAGAIAYFPKPFRNASLFAVIDSVISGEKRSP